MLSLSKRLGLSAERVGLEGQVVAIDLDEAVSATSENTGAWAQTP